MRVAGFISIDDYACHVVIERAYSCHLEWLWYFTMLYQIKSSLSNCDSALRVKEKTNWRIDYGQRHFTETLDIFFN